MTTFKKLKLTCIFTAMAWLGACQSASKSPEVEIVEQGKLSYPKIIEKPLLKAYRHFPELRSNKIYFKFNSRFKAAFMQAQPVISSLLKDKGRREYIIRMKPFFIVGGDTIPIHSVPEDVLVGWLGHEMGHVMDYRERSSGNLLMLGLKYVLSHDAVIIAEKDADIYAINHGLGREIIATKEFILEEQDFPKWYKERIRKFYLTPDDVREYARQEGLEIEEDDSRS